MIYNARVFYRALLYGRSVRRTLNNENCHVGIAAAKHYLC